MIYITSSSVEKIAIKESNCSFEPQGFQVSLRKKNNNKTNKQKEQQGRKGE